jgi:hypothetical protein
MGASAKELEVRLSDEAAKTIVKLAAITGREFNQVVIDSLRTYLWILREQARKRTIVSENGDQGVELENLVRDYKAAAEYFRELDWWREPARS